MDEADNQERAQNCHDRHGGDHSVIRFRRGLLTASDRHLARYLKYVEEFPCFLPAQR